MPNSTNADFAHFSGLGEHDEILPSRVWQSTARAYFCSVTVRAAAPRHAAKDQLKNFVDIRMLAFDTHMRTESCFLPSVPVQQSRPPVFETYYRTIINNFANPIGNHYWLACRCSYKWRRHSLLWLPMVNGPLVDESPRGSLDRRCVYRIPHHTRPEMIRL